MKKKLISLAMLVTVFAMQVVGVSAASKTTGMAVAGESKAYYKAQEMPESMLEQVAAQKQEYADLSNRSMQVQRHYQTLQKLYRNWQDS